MSEKHDRARDFELATIELLALSGRTVHRELLVGHKKVDVVVLDKVLGRTDTVAVECKDYGGRLEQAEVARIYADYLTLVESARVDRILLVTRNGLSPAASAYVDSSRYLTHQTLAELSSSVLDFAQYEIERFDAFDRNGLSELYIPLTSERGHDLEAEVLAWLSEDSNSPMAILGGYGLGKSTFAVRIARVLAERRRVDRTQRIPVLLPLGEISSEQSLEGLVSKALAATHTVGGYDFHRFMEFNRQGRLLVLLDGFDEMKYAISDSQFRYNFEQLNRLVDGRSRVLLLGRPNSFMSDDEHRLILRGERDFKGRLMRVPGAPEYIEHHLALFTRDQVESFLDRFEQHAASQLRAANGRVGYTQHLLRHREVILGKQLADVARRPVQLRMLVDVLPSWQGPLTELTVAKLYDLFIDDVIEREARKPGRHHHSVAVRRRFHRNLAWWLWQRRGDMHFEAHEVPSALCEDHGENAQETVGTVRDLLTGSILERKLGDAFYFPHRSFLEFLVADHVVSTLTNNAAPAWLKDSLSTASVRITSEVAVFIAGLCDDRTLLALRPRLNAYRGAFSRQLATALVSVDGGDKWLVNILSSELSPTTVLLLSWAASVGKLTSDGLVTFRIRLLEATELLITRIARYQRRLGPENQESRGRESERDEALSVVESASLSLSSYFVGILSASKRTNDDGAWTFLESVGKSFGCRPWAGQRDVSLRHLAIVRTLDRVREIGDGRLEVGAALGAAYDELRSSGTTFAEWTSAHDMADDLNCATFVPARQEKSRRRKTKDVSGRRPQGGGR